jgi:hypothetical protein
VQEGSAKRIATAARTNGFKTRDACKKDQSYRDKLESKDCTKKRNLLWVVYSETKRLLRR